MVHLVPEGGLVRAYIISGAEGLMVIDPGSVGTADAVMTEIRRMGGRSMAEVRGIVATHFHFDHIGGIGRLLRECPTGTPVLCHHRVRDYLDGTRSLPRMENWFTAFFVAALKSCRYLRRPSHIWFESLAGIPLPGFGNRFPPPFGKERIRWLGGDGRVRYGIGFDGWDVIETPGHTEDSISLYHEESREFLCGDLILNLDRDGGRLNHFCEDRATAEKTFRFLCETIRPRVIYPGHGEVIRGGENALLGVRIVK
jgi:glyoxylase-like metal-dependent hydrolase (beta-lactamase superfamily II)